MAKQQQLATTKEQLPQIDNELEQYAGAGVSNKPSDNIVPQIKILQPQSPELAEERYKDAKAGDFLSGSTVFSGNTGIWFQPCIQTQMWLEFQPLDRGGGYVGMYPYVEGELPPGATMVDQFHYRMGDNELVHYRQWAGIVWVDRQPFDRIINFKSTGHTIARHWMSYAREANRLPSGRMRPLFGNVYQLRTERITNNKGTWFQLSVGAPIIISTKQEGREQESANILPAELALSIGKALLDAFSTGERVGEVDERQQQQQQQSAF